MLTKEQIKAFNEEYAKEFDSALAGRDTGSLESFKKGKKKARIILQRWQKKCDTNLF